MSDRAPRSESVGVAIAQVESLFDHCETARATLEELRAVAAGETPPAKVSAEDPPVAELCRSIRTNTFEPLARQLSTVVVASPDPSGDLSTRRLEQAVGELGDHHERLMRAVESLPEDPDAIARSSGSESEPTERLDTALSALDHMESTATLLRTLLSESDPAAVAVGEGATESISGTITHGEKPLTDIRVRVREVSLRSRSLLGEAHTDANGQYSLSLDTSGSGSGPGGRKPGTTGGDGRRPAPNETGTSADGSPESAGGRDGGESAMSADESGVRSLLVVVVNDVGEIVGQSEVHHAPDFPVAIDIGIPASRTVEPTEYARLRSKLAPHLDEPLESLSSDAVEFLSGRLSLDADDWFPAGRESLSLLRTAARLAAASPFSEQALYGLLRAGNGIEGRSDLAALGVDAIVDALRTGHDSNVIDVDTAGLDQRVRTGLSALDDALEKADESEHRSHISLRTGEGEPLANHTVRVTDSEQSGVQQTLTTDENGRVPVTYLGDDADGKRTLDVSVHNPAGGRLLDRTLSLSDGDRRELVVEGASPGSAGSHTVGDIQAGETPRTGTKVTDSSGAEASETLDSVRTPDAGSVVGAGQVAGLDASAAGPEQSGGGAGASMPASSGGIRPDVGVTGPRDPTQVAGPGEGPSTPSDAGDGSATAGTAGPAPLGSEAATAESLSLLELTTDLETGTTLANSGYHTQVSIATMPAGAFQESMRESLDPAASNLVHSRSMAQTFYLDSRMVQRRIALANGRYRWDAPASTQGASDETAGGRHPDGQHESADEQRDPDRTGDPTDESGGGA